MIAMTHPKKPGWWYPWIFVVAFSVVFAVNGLLAYFAVSTWNGIVPEDHHAENTVIRDIPAGVIPIAPGEWQVDSNFILERQRETGGADGIFRLRLTDTAGGSLSGARVQGLLMRPVNASHDAELTFHEGAAGTFQAQVSAPLKGEWMVHALIIREGKMFRLEYRFNLPD